MKLSISINMDTTVVEGNNTELAEVYKMLDRVVMGERGKHLRDSNKTLLIYSGGNHVGSCSVKRGKT